MARWGSFLQEEARMWRPADLDPYLEVQEERAMERDYFLEKLKNLFSSYPHFGVPHEPTKIVTGIYLGTTCDAENLDLLHRYQITNVLNCSGHKKLFPRNRRPHTYLESGVVGYTEIEAEDTEEYDMLHHFRQTNDYIKKARLSGGQVLICCSGVSRSATICLAYLLEVKSMYLLEACKMLKELRRVALCNDNFMKQLIDFARECGTLDPCPRKFKDRKFGTPGDRTRLLDIHLPEVHIHKDLYRYKFDKYMY